MDLLAFVLPLFLSIILHEMAHGWMALMLGDTTAKRAGRLTLIGARNLVHDECRFYVRLG